MPPPARGTFPVRRKFLDHASRNSAGVSRLLPLKGEIEMTTANEAYRRAANSPAAREAAETARNIGDDIADAASEVGRFRRHPIWPRARRRRRRLRPGACGERAQPASDPCRRAWARLPRRSCHGRASLGGSAKEAHGAQGRYAHAQNRDRPAPRGGRAVRHRLAIAALRQAWPRSICAELIFPTGISRRASRRAADDAEGQAPPGDRDRRRHAL